MLMKWLPAVLARFGTRTLAGLVAALFVLDLLIPDPLPFVDELILGMATLLLARWSGRRN